VKIKFSQDLKTKKIPEVLENHKTWLLNKNKGVQASLLNYTFQRTVMQGINLRFADLRFSDFREANLRKADLSFANLSFADFSRSNLEGANLKGAILHKTNFKRANLINSDLEGADLSEAITENAVFNKPVDISINKKSYTKSRGQDLQPEINYKRLFCLQCGREFFGYEEILCPDCTLDFACYTEWLVFGEDTMMDF